MAEAAPAPCARTCALNMLGPSGSTEVRCRGLPPPNDAEYAALLRIATLPPCFHSRMLTSGLGHMLFAGLAAALAPPQPMSCERSCRSGVLAAVWGVVVVSGAVAVVVAGVVVVVGRGEVCGCVWRWGVCWSGCWGEEEEACERRQVVCAYIYVCVSVCVV